MNEKLIALKYVKMRILILLLIIFGGQVKAQSPDSSLTRWINGKKYFMHRISPKETFSSLSRQYNVSVSEIQAANATIESLKIGDIVYIPIVPATPVNSSNTNVTPTTPKPDPKPDPKPAPKPAPVKNVPAATDAKQTHTVQKGETLYAISRMYNMTVDDLKKLNGLNSNAVSIGQKLKVIAGAKPIAPINQEIPKVSTEVKGVKEEAPVETTTPPKMETAPAPKEVVSAPVILESTKIIENKTIDTTQLPKVYNNPGTSRTSVIEKDPKSGVEVEKVTEIGVATWIVEGELNQNKFYALHRTAPVGSIIKVTNRMNNNSVFVKVVGTLPDTGDNNASIIKITQAAAQRIGAIDQKFTAELSYGLTR